MFVFSQFNSLTKTACSWVVSLHQASLILALFVLAGLSPATAQIVRTKKPDRGVYRPPLISMDPADDAVDTNPPIAELIRGTERRSISPETQAASATQVNRAQPNSAEPVAEQPEQPRGGPLYETRLDEAGGYHDVSVANVSVANPSESPSPVKTTESKSTNFGLQRVNHDEVILKRPQARTLETEQASWTQTQEAWEEDGSVVFETSGNVLSPNCGCEGNYCDAGCSFGGCDSMPCNGCGSGCTQQGRVCFNRNEWFGSVELLLMFRDGIRLPNLVTTGPANDPAATVGEIGQASTQQLVGNNTSTFDDMSVGGRLTLGTWLDSQRCRSLVGRAWYGGRNTFDFSTSNIQTPVIVRPFFNVTDGQTAAQDNNLIAFPGRSNGDISVNADSNVYGGDVSVRQFWAGGLGATIDVLYGYQYMGFDESLSVSTNSVAIAVPNTPVGTVQSVSDNFAADNQFHGGQLGLAMHYEENCWTFSGLVKSGFGSLRRTSNLSGQTTTTVGTDVDTNNEGFLVQSTNSGKRSDSTFGWVPELDLTLGWHRYPRFDVTAGYHVVAMTDALRVFETVDPDLAVNSSTNPTGQQRPSVSVDYGTFFVHGIHFGLQYRY